jgi:hypothetical protein
VTEVQPGRYRNPTRRDEETSVDYEALGRALAEFCDDHEATPLFALMRRLMREMKSAGHRH